MNEEVKPQDAVVESPDVVSPLEELASLTLDAADAANDSAQSTHESIAKLSQVVETHQEVTRSVRNAPAILGAIMLSGCVVMAIVIAIVFTKVTEKASTLDAAIAAQKEELSKVETALKELKVLQSDLGKFQNIAEETTQRAVVTLREQVKTDRLAVQQLEVRRINEMLASLRSGIASAPRAGASHPDELETKIVALEKSIAGIDTRLRAGRFEAMEEGIKRVDTRLAAIEKSASGPSNASAQAANSRASDALAKDMKTTLEELAGLKAEISTLRGAIERRGNDTPASGPTFRKSAGG